MRRREAGTLEARLQNRWAIVLAGGEGKRLRALTRTLGSDVPKQFCPLLERETLLQLTLRRVALAVDPAQTLMVVTRSHERFFSPMVAEFPQCDLIVQPHNRGTATAIAYGAFRVAEIDPAASVAVFPSDHWFSDDTELMRNVGHAFALVSEFQDLTVALGLAAERPEAGYGWFELGEPIVNEPARLFAVRRFWEKPPADITRAIWNGGAHRNSFILVAKVSALLSLIAKALPRLHSIFHTVRPVVGTTFEGQMIESLYRDLPLLEFSQRVLARSPQAVAVLPVSKLEWSDLGEPRRVLSLLKRIEQTDQREKLAGAIRALGRRSRGAA